MKRDSLWTPDLGDGSYKNPVIFADYSDPDVIRVNSTYYMTASSFNYVPGLPILTSPDLVNWTLVNYALPRIPEQGYAVPRHACGVWAPAIRRHNGRFYIYYGMPDEGIFMVSASDALGAWDAPVCVLPGKGLIDPCPFWDDDGSAWVVHAYAKSRIGFKSFLGIFPMSADGTRAVADDRILYDGRQSQPTIEGPKVYKRDGWYYIFAPAGGVEHGWQTVLRSRSLLGPFEERVVLRQGASPVNGPHQGAWVSATDGEDWFIHFQQRGCYGRVTHLQPMRRGTDGWSRIGIDGEDVGIPCLRHTKPSAHCDSQPLSLQASDDFSGDRLALQWQWMGNPPEGCCKLVKQPPALRLYALPPPPGGAATLWRCPQALTQKFICPSFVAEVTLDAQRLTTGAQAGMAVIGGRYAYIAVRVSDDGPRLVYVTSPGEGVESEPLEQHPLCSRRVALRMSVTANTDGVSAEVRFSYSLNGGFIPIAEPFIATRHTWVGSRVALFCMSVGNDAAGCADFSGFVIDS